MLLKKLGLALGPKELASDILSQKLPSNTYSQFQTELYDNATIDFPPPLFDGVKETLELLKNKNRPFFLVSRRKHPEIAEEILRRYKLWPNFFNKENSFFAPSKKEKAEKIRSLGIDVYLDDEPSILDEIPFVQDGFLFDPAGAYSTRDGYKIIRSWKEFSNILGLN